MTEYKVYLDSDVPISLFRTEINGAFNLRFQDTQVFLTLCAEREIKVVLSDELFREVKRVTGLDKEDALKLMDKNGVATEIVHGTENTEKTARSISRQTGIHRSDAKHISLALESGCNLLVTWNKKDFEKACGHISCANPSDFVLACENTPQRGAPYPLA